MCFAAQATRRNIPILVDAEKKREGLDELLNFATYVVCSAKLPKARFFYFLMYKSYSI